MNKNSMMQALAGVYTLSMHSAKQIDTLLVTDMAEAILPMFPKFDQIAFYVPDIESSKKQYGLLGCNVWVHDTVTAKGYVHSPHGEDPDEVLNVAELAFNYNLGIELELIHYCAGENWHSKHKRVNPDGSCHHAFLSHMSYHVDDLQGEILRLEGFGFRIAQNVKTISHANTHLSKIGRKYNYVVFNTRASLGFDIKLINRLEDFK